MSNPIQAIRNVYDIAKTARDNDLPMSDDEILLLLKRTVSDTTLISSYSRFEKGYAAEDLFMRIYSLLPWIKSVVPLGQEQFPEKSKEQLQVPDYEIMFEAGSSSKTSSVLVEVKLIDGDKQTYELQKYKYDVLKKYSQQKHEPLLFGLFWRKQKIWTINSIESFSKKSSCYKISFYDAMLNDLSAIFGDYTYIFPMQYYRKSTFTSDPDIKTEFIHSHLKYGRTVSEELSLDLKTFKSLNMLEPPVLDCAFDFKVIFVNTLPQAKTELIEQCESIPRIFKLSSLLLAYLCKIYCLDTNTLYYKDNTVVENAFNIVDVVRQKCGGIKYYALPYIITKEHSNLITLQFGNVQRIMNAYQTFPRIDHKIILISHD